MSRDDHGDGATVFAGGLAGCFGLRPEVWMATFIVDDDGRGIRHSLRECRIAAEISDVATLPQLSIICLQS